MNWNDRKLKIYFIFLSLVIIWCFLIVLAPLLAAKGHTFTSGLVYFGFSKVCHQMASRSFFLFGHQLAVCSRCTGIYAGFLISSLAFFPIYFILKKEKITRISAGFFWTALVFLTADFLSGYTALNNTFLSRFLSGFFIGIIAVFFVLPPIMQIGEKRNNKNSEK